MFARKLLITREDGAGKSVPVALAWLDSFAMRNFTNDAAFDDTLPTADGQMEAGFRVELPALRAAMESWFRRKVWLAVGERLVLRVQQSEPRANENQSEPS